MPLNSANACEISSEQWTAAGHSEQKMVNLINRLKIRHTKEAAKERCQRLESERERLESERGRLESERDEAILHLESATVSMVQVLEKWKKREEYVKEIQAQNAELQGGNTGSTKQKRRAYSPFKRMCFHISLDMKHMPFKRMCFHISLDMDKH
jgi:hypothetical protein